MTKIRSANYAGFVQTVTFYIVYLYLLFYRTLHRSMYIAMPFVTIAYLLINLSYFAVLSVGEITDATAVALVSSVLYT